jgi:hypothetical protein
MPDFSYEALLIQHQKLREMAQGFRQAQILLTCIQLGVFEALKDGHATASEVAQSIASDPRGTELLLNAAAALDLVEKSEDRFSNKPLVAACLLAEMPGTMVRSFRLQAAFYQRWAHLAEAVRTGERPEENRQINNPLQITVVENIMGHKLPVGIAKPGQVGWPNRLVLLV